MPARTVTRTMGCGIKGSRSEILLAFHCIYAVKSQGESSTCRFDPYIPERARAAEFLWKFAELGLSLLHFFFSTSSARVYIAIVARISPVPIELQRCFCAAARACACTGGAHACVRMAIVGFAVVCRCV